jgi:hypothetical protein
LPNKAVYRYKTYYEVIRWITCGSHALNFRNSLVLWNKLIQRSFRYNQIFGWKLSECIRDRFERTIDDLALWIKSPIIAETSINCPGRFFHYEPLFTSSFGKKFDDA